MPEALDHAGEHRPVGPVGWLAEFRVDVLEGLDDLVVGERDPVPGQQGAQGLDRSRLPVDQGAVAVEGEGGHTGEIGECHAERPRRKPIVTPPPYHTADLGLPGLIPSGRGDDQDHAERGDVGRLAPLLPPQKPRTGRPSLDHRRFLEAVLWLARTGAPWRDLPPELMNWRTRLAPAPALDGRRRLGADHRRAAGDGAGGGLGGAHARQHRRPRPRPRGGGAEEGGRAGAGPLARRLLDQAPPPLRRPRPAGHVPPHRRRAPRPDRRRAAVRARGLAHRQAWPAALEAGGGDRRQGVLGRLAARRAPPQADRARHPEPVRPAREPRLRPRGYRGRNLVERLVGKLKQFRRVATRYDKLAPHYLAFVQLASIMVWLRTFGDTA